MTQLLPTEEWQFAAHLLLRKHCCRSAMICRHRLLARASSHGQIRARFAIRSRRSAGSGGFPGCYKVRLLTHNLHGGVAWCSGQTSCHGDGVSSRHPSDVGSSRMPDAKLIECCCLLVASRLACFAAISRLSCVRLPSLYSGSRFFSMLVFFRVPLSLWLRGIRLDSCTNHSLLHFLKQTVSISHGWLLVTVCKTGFETGFC